MSNEEYDVVRIRHPFYRKRYWRIDKSLSSVYGDITLYRVQLLKDNGETDSRQKPVVIKKDLVIENVGGYQEWLKSLNNN